MLLVLQQTVNVLNVVCCLHMNIFQNQPRPHRKFHFGAFHGVENNFLELIVNELLWFYRTPYGRFTSSRGGCALHQALLPLIVAHYVFKNSNNVELILYSFIKTNFNLEITNW